MTLHRVVFDTSTLVSAALRAESIPRQALQQALRYCEVCASKETLDELSAVLARAKFRSYAPDMVRQEFVRIMQTQARLFVVRDWAALGVAPACRDPFDDKVLALAFEAEADAIVSSDEDLLVLHPWNEIQIVRPGDFLKQVG